MDRISGMLRAAAFSPRVHLANPMANMQEIALCLRRADRAGVQLCVFPELCLTGATCGDLFFNDALLEGAKDALCSLLALDVKAAFVVGLPLEMNGRVYNCAAVVHKQQLALVPRCFPGRDSRWFAPGKTAPTFAQLFGASVPVRRGGEALFALNGSVFGVCVGADMDMPLSPADSLAAQGAMILAHPHAAPEFSGSMDMRRQMTACLSRRLLCAVVSAGAGEGESTTDFVYGGSYSVVEEGRPLTSFMPAIADVDLARLRYRRRLTGFETQTHADPLDLGCAAGAIDLLMRPLSQTPFIPEDNPAARFEEILSIQARGLIARMNHIGTQKLVIGVSGGLDSTLALLVAAYAFDTAHFAPGGIFAITMPGLGTSKRTHDNAESLSSLLGCTALEIPIGPAVAQHFADIGQDPQKHDICYENSQARERTQILMDYANRVGGIVLGTGDLSELALGFCTYNGDQMSMYNVNGSIPKTLMRRLVDYISRKFGEDVHRVVTDVVLTPVSPELVPGEEEISQKTEDILGSYHLHDFFLFHMMDSGAGPKKLFALAQQAFHGQFDDAAILKALDTFVRRFFSQQFKRSAMPDGPDATGFSLSPRGGFAAPSDAQRALWMAEVESLKK